VTIPFVTEIKARKRRARHTIALRFERVFRSVIPVDLPHFDR
jgi:hypothetical protein